MIQIPEKNNNLYHDVSWSVKLQEAAVLYWTTIDAQGYTRVLGIRTVLQSSKSAQRSWTSASPFLPAAVTASYGITWCGWSPPGSFDEWMGGKYSDVFSQQSHACHSNAKVFWEQTLLERWHSNLVGDKSDTPFQSYTDIVSYTCTACLTVTFPFLAEHTGHPF